LGKSGPVCSDRIVFGASIFMAWARHIAMNMPGTQSVHHTCNASNIVFMLHTVDIIATFWAAPWVSMVPVVRASSKLLRLKYAETLHAAILGQEAFRGRTRYTIFCFNKMIPAPKFLNLLPSFSGTLTVTLCPTSPHHFHRALTLVSLGDHRRPLLEFPL